MSELDSAIVEGAGAPLDVVGGGAIADHKQSLSSKTISVPFSSRSLNALNDGGRDRQALESEQNDP